MQSRENKARRRRRRLCPPHQHQHIPESGVYQYSRHKQQTRPKKHQNPRPGCGRCVELSSLHTAASNIIVVVDVINIIVFVFVAGCVPSRSRPPRHRGSGNFTQQRCDCTVLRTARFIIIIINFLVGMVALSSVAVSAAAIATTIAIPDPVHTGTTTTVSIFVRVAATPATATATGVGTLLLAEELHGRPQQRCLLGRERTGRRPVWGAPQQRNLLLKALPRELLVRLGSKQADEAVG